MQVVKLSSSEIRKGRLKIPVNFGHVVFAALWPKSDVNLGTLARTADAINGSMVTVKRNWGREAVKRGNTIGLNNTMVEYVLDVKSWLGFERDMGSRIVGVELAVGSIPLKSLAVATERTVVVLGHESQGIPQWALDLCTEVVEIPMSGVGNSLNVAVAGSLVGYKLAGLS